MSQTTLIVELLLVAIAVAIVVKYIRLPYMIALVLAGAVVGLLPEVPALPVDPKLWLLLFLPPLLFEGAINMDLDLLRRYAAPVGLLAFFGTLISVALLTATFHFLLGIPIEVAALLGVMLSPTDPVSVLALFKEQGVPRPLQTLVEGESVFNDGIAVVLYLIVLEVLSGTPVTFAEATIEFVRVIVGGALVGIVLGYLTHRLYKLLDDHLVEVGSSVVLAYGSYLVAERLEVSGVIAVAVAGLIIGNYGRILSMSPSTRLSLTHFWEVGAFLINSVLFLLIGLTVERGGLFNYLPQIALVFVGMLAARAIGVFGLLEGYQAISRHFLPKGWVQVVNWGGLRGSIPVALALGLPFFVPELERLRAITLGAVFLSLLVQGLSIKSLLLRLGLTHRSPEQDEFERAQGVAIAARAALNKLEQLHSTGEISDRLHQKMQAFFESLRRDSTEALADVAADYSAVRRRQLSRVSAEVFTAQRAAIDEALRRGLLGEEVWRDLKHEFDAMIVEGDEAGWERLWQEEEIDVGPAYTEPPE